MGLVLEQGEYKMSESRILNFLKQSCTGMTTAELKSKCEEEGVRDWLAELKKLKEEEYVRIDQRLPKPVLKATPKAFV